MYELLTPLQMKKADRLTIEGGTSGLTLMHNAGKVVLEALQEILYPHSRILVLCGPGNNGGDGFVVAQLASDEGFDVRVALVCDPAALTGDAELAYDEMSLDLTSLENMRSLMEEVSDDDVIVDALFGAGLSRPLDYEILQLVQRINASSAQCVAIDLPSGVSGKSGEVQGEAVHADITVTFFRAKPGHYLFPGRAHCGEIIIEQIGLEDDVLSKVGPTAFYNCDKIWGDIPDMPAVAGHKYNRGHTLVVSGPKFATGASRLAARAAQRAGSGLVSIVAREQAAHVHAAHLNSIMICLADRIADFERILEDQRLNCVVIGPAVGVGRETQERVVQCLLDERGVVIDADALMSFEPKPEILFEYIAQAQTGARVVLTPHEEEFRRLFPDLNEATSTACKVERVQQAAARAGAVVVLKGADTVIADPAGAVAINASGTPWLASAGTGDVLAGIIGGYLAQGLSAYQAAAKGVWVHGRAAEYAGDGLIAEEVIDHIPDVITELVEYVEGF
ncbi:Bifunctional NAD(P)H-hydrate repair enzyme Nnr [Pseudovibrio axinellae]|uniref:Bifunctional NAD(P)H-hydrate repair enzyme n=1 Tax=Pseudovibrio axinellae TaxID=989403 RepID=A0A166B2X5_9HYPH|nr:bifunctional ADP-dependent NAD(P)H-hydrate dehydratase/NAD(P)H-hydrate epimerase [Pseudovibrio axinellae]KZL21842.1 Bifunctional NAD(P)H-hydrate repair enzyme Nnr [Pseudovibrio axinellae]SEQ80472.1 yjeF C-terminal region, hydroxyethylthiazole kinase-related/yjeF N-terminal region [Pseudovibrio axinellae]